LFFILSKEVNQTDALHVPCDWQFAALHTFRCMPCTSDLITISGSNPELTDNVYTKCTWSKQGWISMVLSTLNLLWVCSTIFMLQASGIQVPI